MKLITVLFILTLFSCTSSTPEPLARSSNADSSGLVVAYAFDEGTGTSSVDASGNGFTASLLSGASWATGHTSYGALFNGNAYESSGNIPALSGLSTLTVSAWVKGAVASGSPDGVLIVKDAAFALVATSKVFFGIKSGNTWYGWPTSTTVVNSGAFHHLAGSYDGSTLRVYVDGTLEASQNIGAHTLNTSTVPLQLASCVGGPNCESNGEHWSGVLDDVRIYSRALTLAEIQSDRDTPVSSGDTGGAGAGAGGAGGAGAGGAGGSGAGGAGAGGSGATCSNTVAVTYSTDFGLVESPVSENGAFHHLGLDWATIGSNGCQTYSTQSLAPRSSPYNDAYAYLAGFPPNHSASGVVYQNVTDGSCSHEVEILLRWADAAHTARGYECNLSWNGAYSEIVRWNGPLGDFTYLDRQSVSGGVHTGDVLSCEVVGNAITLKVNGSAVASANDSTWTDGNPGLSIFRGTSGCGSLLDYGFSSFSATGSE